MLLQFPCRFVPRAHTLRAPNYAIIQIAICIPRLFLVDPDAGASLSRSDVNSALCISEQSRSISNIRFRSRSLNVYMCTYMFFFIFKFYDEFFWVYSKYHRGNIQRKYKCIYVRIAADDATSVVRKRLRIRIHYAGDAYRKFE